MKPRLLYIASGGVEEPLIVSQVLRYLKRLNGVFEVCHLLTFERSMPANSNAILRELAADNIQWHGLKSNSGFRMFNVWREIFRGYQQGKKLIAQHDLNLIHSRSFLPGNIGLRLARKTGAKLLYDMRGFWAQEKQAKGTIQSGWLGRITQSMEDRIFRNADALISLTDAGKEKLRRDGVRTPIHVIPCCVDTDLFRPATDRVAIPDAAQPLRLISVGSLGPGYLPQAVFGLFQSALEQDPSAKLQLLSRSDSTMIRRIAKEENCDWDRISLDAAGPAEVVDYLQMADAGLCMIQPSAAKVASSPTKLAEYLACGLPVVANAGLIGDVGKIIKEHRVGVVVEQFDRTGFQQAIAKLSVLLRDPELKSRCRTTAVNHFSVDVAADRYATAYDQLLAGN
jgi:glycosyltransferase involved in cell wall biosynthesis